MVAGKPLEKAKFSGMLPWRVATDLIEPSESIYKLDIGHYGYVEEIVLRGEALVFRIHVHPYERVDAPLEEEWVVELIFHKVSVIKIQPDNLLPYRGRLGTDTFLSEPGKGVDQDRIHIHWCGRAATKRLDPEIIFWADNVEYKRIS